MGNIGTAGLAQIGLGAANLLNSANKNTKKISYLSQEQEANTRKRQNLLEQQLATRRAGLGVMGISSSNSAAAVQKRMAAEAYDDMATSSEKYQQKYDELQGENQRNISQGILNMVLSNANKLIK